MNHIKKSLGLLLALLLCLSLLPTFAAAEAHTVEFHIAGQTITLEQDEDTQEDWGKNVVFKQLHVDPGVHACWLTVDGTDYVFEGTCYETDIALPLTEYAGTYGQVSVAAGTSETYILYNPVNNTLTFCCGGVGVYRPLDEEPTGTEREGTFTLPTDNRPRTFKAICHNYTPTCLRYGCTELLDDGNETHCWWHYQEGNEEFWFAGLYEDGEFGMLMASPSYTYDRELGEWVVSDVSDLHPYLGVEFEMHLQSRCALPLGHTYDRSGHCTRCEETAKLYTRVKSADQIKNDGTQYTIVGEIDGNLYFLGFSSDGMGWAVPATIVDGGLWASTPTLAARGYTPMEYTIVPQANDMYSLTTVFLFEQEKGTWANAIPQWGVTLGDTYTPQNEYETSVQIVFEEGGKIRLTYEALDFSDPDLYPEPMTEEEIEEQIHRQRLKLAMYHNEYGEGDSFAFVTEYGLDYASDFGPVYLYASGQEPQENPFRTYLLDAFDTDGDGALSEDECEAVTVIDLSGAYQNPDDPDGEYTYADCVTSLAGIEDFPNLGELYCDPFTFGVDGKLTGVDLSRNTKLRVVDLGCNPLETLDVSGLTDLEELAVGFTNLRSLNLANNTMLKKLIASDSLFDRFDLSHNPRLEQLDVCGNPNLVQLDISACESLMNDYLNGERSIDLPYLAGLHVYGGEGTSYNLAISPWTQIVLPAKVCTLTVGTTDGSHTDLGSVDVTPTGTLYQGNSVTVTAPTVAGYSFVGWYNGETKVSDTPVYAFVIANATALTAKYAVKTVPVKVGVISYVMNEASTGYQVRYWNDAGLTGDADLTAAGETETVDVGYWDAAQTFTMFTAEVPATATGFKVHNGDRWFSGDGVLLNSNTVYIFNYSGDKADYRDRDAAFCGHKLKLSNEIGVMFKIRLKDGVNTENCYMEFTYSDGRDKKTQTLSEATKDGDFYWFTAYTNVLELGNVVTAVFHYGDQVIAENDYSALAYIEEVKNRYGEATPTGKLVRALQDYGHYMRASGWVDGLDTHTRIDAVTEINASDFAEIPNRFAIKRPTVDGTTVTFSLTLNSQTRINVISKFNGKEHIYQSDPIGPKNLGTMIDIEIDTSDGPRTGTVTVCPLSYAYAVLQSPRMSNAKKAAMTAYYNYYLAACEYKDD